MAITNLQRKFDKLLFFYLFVGVGSFSYILVKKGSVYAGQIIGYSGISGIRDGTCGPHLHFEIRSERRCGDLTKRCNPAYYVYYKVKMSPEEKRKQEERMKKGQLKDFYGRK